MTSWLRASGDGVTLSLHIQPGAKSSEIVGLHGDALKVRLAAPPVDGKANAALLEFIADCLEVARNRVELKSGQSTRRKVLAVAGIDLDTASRRLAAGIGGAV